MAEPITGTHEAPGLSLAGLIDLLAALESEISQLPQPAPLFVHELERALMQYLWEMGYVS